LITTTFFAPSPRCRIACARRARWPGHRSTAARQHSRVGWRSAQSSPRLRLSGPRTCWRSRAGTAARFGSPSPSIPTTPRCSPGPPAPAGSAVLRCGISYCSQSNAASAPSAMPFHEDREHARLRLGLCAALLARARPGGSGVQPVPQGFLGKVSRVRRCTPGGCPTSAGSYPALVPVEGVNLALHRLPSIRPVLDDSRWCAME
jgi:hypothetical protein